MNEQEYKDEIIWLISYLARERKLHDPSENEMQSISVDQLWTLLRGMFNTRPAGHASSEFYKHQDKLLKAMIEEAGITEADALIPPADGLPISLWLGDITTLRADAIVNAANSELLGCWQPNHMCIDNAIQTFAGVQMREECAQIMQRQGHAEPTGECKVTHGYNLPATWVLHTVGPIANGKPTAKHRAQLASCYLSCLEAAAGLECKSLAFCSISTGVFGFPMDQAAPIAVDTVKTWLSGHPDAKLHVIFNVFDEDSEREYRKLLRDA
jgi:O-acetyl-ADP-ribose deacetylase (regulator of RNase III)